MGENSEKGIKWWVRYFIVPILTAAIAGGGLYIFFKLQPEQTTVPLITTTPTPERPSNPTYRTVKYNTNYGRQGETSINFGSEYTVYNEVGCGPSGGYDILKCIVHSDGTIQAYNKDCDSRLPILGRRTSEGCSRASYNQYFLECCIVNP